MSLQSYLKNYLQTHGYLTYSELVNFCTQGIEGRTYKVDTGRRKLDNLPVKKTEKNGSTVLWEWCGEPPVPLPHYRKEIINNTVHLFLTK